MTSNNFSVELNEVTELLSSTRIKGAVKVSFADQHLKLDSEKEASGIVAAIEESGPHLEYLCLEGNTLGQGAAKAIGKALEKCPDLKHALWKDLFTGRLKNEIPAALRSLSSGILLSGAQLVELDLSDNALGPVGTQGLLTLFSSRACWCLETLKLDNNGLGPEGSQAVFGALRKALKDSKEDPSHPAMPLKKLVCGRNRLENVGATALGEMLMELGTLEELCLPQNGICKEGVEALAKGLEHNKRLRTLDLNDNILTPAGASNLAQALQHFEGLEMLNLGDCLVRTTGALAIADVLKDGHPQLKELHLGYNEVFIEGGLAIAEAMSNKELLEVLELDGNCFGEQGIAHLEAIMESAGKGDKLCALGNDEGSSACEGESQDEEGEEDESECAEKEDVIHKTLEMEENANNVVQKHDTTEGASSLKSSKQPGQSEEPPSCTTEEMGER